MDPLAEKYPAISPFTYVFNNPIRLVDPNGMETEGDIYNNKGVHIGNDGVMDNKAYFLNTNSDKFLTTKESKSVIKSGSAALLGITNSELNLRSFLSALRSTENLPQSSPLGYNSQYGGGGPGGVFTQNTYEECPEAYCQHPLMNSSINGGTPAGAYQFTRKTWNKELVGRFGLNSDFVPENQDKGASLLIPSKAKDYLSSNNLNGALNLTNNLWSSLPGGRHSKIDFKGFFKIFNEYRRNEMFGISIIATPVGKLK
ncbi:MAG: hypothetical protein U0V54_03525 [Saprospiraceae bacterium]